MYAPVAPRVPFSFTSTFTFDDAAVVVVVPNPLFVFAAMFFVTVVMPGPDTVTVSGVSTEAKVKFTAPRPFVVNLKLSTSVSEQIAALTTLLSVSGPYAVAGVSFGSVTSTHGAASGPKLPPVATTTNACGGFAVTRVPVTIA